MKAMTAVESAPAPILMLHKSERRGHCERVTVLMAMFGLSLADVVAGSGKALSKSQFHRILHGQPPTPFERRAIAVGLIECLRVRIDSAFLFAESEGENHVR